MSDPTVHSSQDGQLPRRRFITGVGGVAAGAAIGGVVVSSPAYAQPITYEPGFSGPANFAHGDTVTINGPGGTSLGFGTKANASPLLWDNASGPADVTNLWNGRVEPSPADVPAHDPYFDMKRRQPIRGINPPHNIVGRYLAGCANLGRSAGVLLTRAMPWTGPTHFYASFWQRLDPAWLFGDPATSDNNLKCAVWANADQPSDPPYNHARPGGVHINYNYPTGPGAVESMTDAFIKWQIYSSAKTTMMGQDGRYSLYGGISDCAHPMKQWVKYEFEHFFTDSSNGFIRISENGRRVLTYNGRTDADPKALRLFTVGGFGRHFGPDQWRYFTDLYLDNSLGRVVIGNSAMNVRELQYPTAWTDTSLTFKVWRGAHGTLAGKSLYVVSTRSPNNLIKVATIG